MGEQIRRLELEWLARQSQPVWGGHLERGEPLPQDSGIGAYLRAGLIERHDALGRKGYRITRAGLEFIEGQRPCPLCGSSPRQGGEDAPGPIGGNCASKTRE